MTMSPDAANMESQSYWHRNQDSLPVIIHEKLSGSHHSNRCNPLRDLVTRSVFCIRVGWLEINRRENVRRPRSRCKIFMIVPRARSKCFDIMLVVANGNFITNACQDTDISIMGRPDGSRSSHERSPSRNRASQCSIVVRLSKVSPRTEVNSAWIHRAPKFCIWRNLIMTHCSSLSMHLTLSWCDQMNCYTSLEILTRFSCHCLLSMAKLCRVWPVWGILRIWNLPAWQWDRRVYSQLVGTFVLFSETLKSQYHSQDTTSDDSGCVLSMGFQVLSCMQLWFLIIVESVTGYPLNVRNLTQGVSGGDSFFARNCFMPVTRKLFKREILWQFGAATRRAFYREKSKSATRPNTGTALHSEIPLERGQ
jgi:hypothetical protein